MLDFFIAFLTSALAGTGVGGGGLYVIYLTLVRGVPQLKAGAINLAFFIIGSLFSLLFHFQKRNINLPLVLFVGAFGAAGSLLGANLASVLHAAFLSKCFGAFLVFCGLRTFFSK